MAYGSGVNPAFKGSVTSLYPFNFHSVVDGKSVHNGEQQSDEGVCGGNGPMRVASGQVVSVEKEGFKIRLDTGEYFNIHVNPCTRMNANVPDYEMKEGDEAIVKGTRKGYNIVSASQMTCLEN